VVAATNSDLRSAVRQRRFREDLFYRLTVIELTLPPLRERAGDIPVLAHYFLRKSAVDHGLPAPTLSPEAIDALERHTWPGNIRELENVIQRAVILSGASWILPEHLGLSLETQTTRRPVTSFRALKAEAVAAFERRFLEDTLAAHNGNISRAARSVSKNRRAFWELLRKYRLHVRPSSSAALDNQTVVHGLQSGDAS
jgi:DNA-binding NtrC family response regulator